jgi:hypothetical protein
MRFCLGLASQAASAGVMAGAEVALPEWPLPSAADLLVRVDLISRSKVRLCDVAIFIAYMHKSFWWFYAWNDYANACQNQAFKAMALAGILAKSVI